MKDALQDRLDEKYGLEDDAAESVDTVLYQNAREMITLLKQFKIPLDGIDNLAEEFNYGEVG